MERVTVKEIVDEWENKPAKLFSWLMRLLWEAEIKPSDSIFWLAKDGKITIQNTGSFRNAVK